MHINVSPEVEHKLRELAAQCGADIADLIETLLAHEIHAPEMPAAVPDADNPTALPRALAAMQHRSPEEVERARACWPSASPHSHCLLARPCWMRSGGSGLAMRQRDRIDPKHRELSQHCEWSGILALCSAVASRPTATPSSQLLEVKKLSAAGVLSLLHFLAKSASVLAAGPMPQCTSVTRSLGHTYSRGNYAQIRCDFFRRREYLTLSLSIRG